MNYEKIYNQIIERAKSENRIKWNGIYYERHHIVPICMGGDPGFKKNKIVLLTAREHFICHMMLCEMYPDNSKLRFAFWSMCNQKNLLTHERKYTVGSRIYKSLRESLKVTEETKAKIANSHKGIKKSEKHCQAMRKPKSKLKCPVCGKEGRGGNMYRHHFDNCGKDLIEVLGKDWYLKNKMNQPNRRPVHQFDMDGVFIKEWNSVSDATKEYRSSHVYKAIRGKREHACGYKWAYADGGLPFKIFGRK